MNNKIKILILGISQSNFLNQLYGEILKKTDRYAISIDGFYDVSKGQVKVDSIYSNYYDLKKAKSNRIQLYKNFLSFIFTPFFWEIFHFELSQKKGIKQVYNILFSYAWARYTVKHSILPLKQDIFHFHYCNPENLKFLHFLPSDSKIICSFWGSDLMRETGTENVFYVKKALEKATIITIQTLELAEMLYCKYGRELKSKMQVAQFTIHTGIYDQIDVYKNNTTAIEDFKTKNAIPTNKISIAISHNAFQANNHIEILNELNKLDAHLKNEIVVLLPLGYGRSDTYLAQLDAIINKIENIEIVKLDKFYNPEETALLRLATDLMIQMPISDALSGAMTEVLYAGNQVLSAAWLPYGMLRRNGVVYYEIENFNAILDFVTKYVSHKDDYKVSNNDTAIKSFLFPDTTTAQWLSILDSIKK